MPGEVATSGRLPSPPGVVMEILRLVADEESTVEDLARVIEADPVLAARLLGTVNSGLYTLVREIHKIEEAAVLVGFRSIRTLALSVSVTEGMPGGPACPGFDIGMYWRHCLMTAVLGKRLALEVKKQLCEDVFSVGLIANLGRLVAARCIPDRYSAALTTSPWPDLASETRVMGFCTAEISAALLHQWGLPDSLCLSVRYHADQENLPEDCGTAVATTTSIVGATDAAVDHLLRAEDADAIHHVATELNEAFDLGTRVVHQVLDDASQQIGEVQHLISSNVPEDISPVELISRAQQLLEEAAA
ncbi:MAG: HDOD domain-containing protein [Actinomycetota bacterium]